MKTEHIVLIGAGIAIAGVGGYYLYRRSQAAQLPASATYPAAQQGLLQNSSSLLQSGREIINQVSNLIKPAQSNLEGKLIRVNKGHVYYVQGNLLHYVDLLPTRDGRFKWGDEINVGNVDLKEGIPYTQLVAQSNYIDPAQPWLGTMPSNVKGLGKLPLLLTLN